MPEAAKLFGAALRSVYAISGPIKLKGANPSVVLPADGNQFRI